MVVSKYPASNGGLRVAKGVFCLFAIVLGSAFGRNFLHHRVLRNPWKIKGCGPCKERTVWQGGGLNMFEQFQGSWSCMICCSVIFLMMASRVYNSFLTEDLVTDYSVSAMCGLEFVNYARITQACTWFGDLFTLVMTVDSMLQDQGLSAVEDKFKGWATGFKVAYREKWGGRFRVVFMYVLAGGSTAAMLYSIIGENFNEETEWDFATRGWGTDEAGRVLLGSCITLCDIFILMQDWDFPTFDSQLDVKLPFTDMTELSIKLPKKLTDPFTRMLDFIFEADFFHFTVSGKWFSYGPLLCIICLDLMMMKNQIVYEPHLLGQYTDPGDHIYTIIDMAVIEQVQANFTWAKEYLTWENRMGHPNATALGIFDPPMTAKYSGHSMMATGLLACIGFSGVVIFIRFVKKLNVSPEQRDAMRKRRVSLATQLHLHHLHGVGDMLTSLAAKTHSVRAKASAQAHSVGAAAVGSATKIVGTAASATKSVAVGSYNTAATAASATKSAAVGSYNTAAKAASATKSVAVGSYNTAAKAGSATKSAAVGGLKKTAAAATAVVKLGGLKKVIPVGDDDAPSPAKAQKLAAAKAQKSEVAVAASDEGQLADA
jgi:hypothetical protein